MEITKFGLKNFRVFKEYFDFDLAPIMVLTGPNNSGKSSLTKALLLLKDNEDMINGGDDGEISTKLNYFKGEHELGNHKLTVNTKDENTIFSFTFFLEYKFLISINNEGISIGHYLFTTENNDFIIFHSEEEITINVQYIIKYFIDKITHHQSAGLNTILDSNINLKKINKLIARLKYFEKDIHTINVDLIGGSIQFKYHNQSISFEKNLEKGIYSSKYFDHDVYYEDFGTTRQENLVFLFFRLTSIKLTKEEILFLLPTSTDMWDLDDKFFQFSDIIYVNTIKEPLKRAYSKNDSSVIKTIIMDGIEGHKGDIVDEDNNASKYQILTRRKPSLIDDARFEFLEKWAEEINQFERKWLKEFEIGEELSYGYDEENDIFFLKVDNKSLLEYGLGLSSVIRILLAIGFKKNCINKKQSDDIFLLSFPVTMIIEEPETGLHPAFQSKMAEMLVDIQKTFKMNLIIETHSEYFIRKLQYLTATKEINPGDAVIYYFNNPKKVPENEEQIKKITISKDGSLSDNFGPGFIDEAANLKFDLLRLAKNQKN